MAAAQVTNVLLDEARAAFIQHRVSISVAARDAGNVPSLTRAFGCRVSPDRRRITVFVSTNRSQRLLEDVRATGALAVVFSRPATHETIQLKGSDAEVVALAPGDREAMQALSESFVSELTELGYAEPFVRALVSGAGEEAVGLRFTPTAAFEQTPGPGAGRRLGA